MKTNVALIIVILIAAGLGIGLVTGNKRATEMHQKDVETIMYHSNQWSETSAKLDEQKQVNVSLESDIAARKTDIAKLSNDLAQTSQTLTKTAAELQAAKEETAKRDTKIAELETQNQALDKQAEDLKGSIGNLETKIADTQKKLSASEGDKAFLEKELQRLMAEKDALEKQFNDLAVLREQVHKLKAELSVARRLDWIRQGLFANQDAKGAQKLMQGVNSGAKAAGGTNNYDLNVEVNADGSIKVLQPVTNTPVSNSVPNSPTSPPPAIKQ